MTISFEGKVAIVTGAGGGLGREHALELARRGAKVVVNDLGGSVEGTGGSATAAEKVVGEIKSAGGEAVANGDSVSDPKAAGRIVETAMDAFGGVDIVINNAGILRDKTFRNMELEDFQAVVDVHLMGAVYVTKAAWPHMYEKQYGRIVMTTSSSGLFGNFGQTNYSAAKLALVGFASTLRLEGQSKNVFTNCIAPVAATRMTENLMPKERLASLDPKLVTPAVVYLVSEDAPNGVVVQAGGGRYWMAQMFENEGMTLGTDVTVEDFAENWDKISDMSTAKGRELRVRAS